MSAALRPQLTAWTVLAALAALALVFVVVPAAAGLLIHRRRGRGGRS